MKSNIVELQHLDIAEFKSWTKSHATEKIIFDTTGTAATAVTAHEYKRFRVDFNPNTITVLDSKEGKCKNYTEFRNVEYVVIVKDLVLGGYKLFIKCKDDKIEHVLYVA